MRYELKILTACPEVSKALRIIYDFLKGQNTWLDAFQLFSSLQTLGITGDIASGTWTKGLNTLLRSSFPAWVYVGAWIVSCSMASAALKAGVSPLPPADLARLHSDIVVTQANLKEIYEASLMWAYANDRISSDFLKSQIE